MRISFIWYCILWICSYAWSWAQQQQQQTPEKQDIVIFGVDLEKTDFKQNLRTVDAYNEKQAYIGGGGSGAEAGKANFIITYRKGDFQDIGGIISEYRGQSFGFKKKDPAVVGGIQATNSIFGNSPVNNQIYSISLFPYKLAKEAMQTTNQQTTNTEPIPQGFFVSRENNSSNGGNGVGDKSYIFRFWDRYKKPAAAGAPAANPQNLNPTGIELDMDNKNVSNDKINALVAVDTNKVLAVGKVLKVFDGRKNKWKNYVDSAKDPATKSSKIKKEWELNGIATLRKKPGEPDTAYIVGQKGVFIRVPFQVCLKTQQQPPAAATEDSIKIDTALILNNFCKDCKPNNNCANCTGCVSKPDVGQGLPCNGGDTNLTAVAVFKDIVWVTSDKGTIYKSTDSGRTFKKETLEKGKVLAYNSDNTTIRVETEVDPSKNKAFYSISFPNANGGYAAGEAQENKIPLIYENVCNLDGKIPRNLPCCDPQKPLPKVKSSNCKWQPSPALSNRYNAVSYPTWYGTSFINTDLGWLVGSSGALIRYAPDFDMSCELKDIEELRNIQNVNIYDYREQGGAKKTKLPPNQYYGGEREVSLLNMGTAEVAVCSRDDQPAIPLLEDVKNIINYNDDVVPQKLQQHCGKQSPNFNYTSDPKDCRQIIDPPPNNQNNDKCERIPPKTYKPATYVRVHNFGRALIGTEWELVNRPANLYFFLPRAGKQLPGQNNPIRNNDLTKNRLLSPSYNPLKEEQTSPDPPSKFCTDTTHVRIRTKINGKEQHALCYDTLLKSSYENRTDKDTGYPIPQMNTHLTANVIVNNVVGAGAGGGAGTTNHKEVLPDTVRGGFWGRQSSNNQGKRVPYTIGVGVLAPNFSLSPMITPLVFALGHSRTTFDTLFVVQPGLVPYLYAQGENNTSFGNRSKYLREHSNAYPEMQDSFHIVTNAAYKIYMKNAPAPYSLKIDNLNGKSGQNGENGKIEDTPILRRFNKYIEGTFNRPTLNITGKWLYTNSAKTSLDTIVVRGIGPCMDMKMEKNAGTNGTTAATNNRNLKVDEKYCYNDSIFLVMRRDPLYYKITTQDKKTVSYKDFPDTNNKDYNSPANKVTHLLFEANGKPKVNIFELETDTRYKFKLGGAYQKKPKDAPQNSGTGTGKPSYEKADYHKERFHIRLYKKEKADPGKQDEDTIKFKGGQTKKAWDSLHIENYDTGGKTCPDPRAANTQVATTGTNDKLYNGITPLYVQTVLRKSNYWDKPRYDTITYEVTGYHDFKQPQGSKERTRRFATIIVKQEAAQLFLLRQGRASDANPGFDPSVPKDVDEKIDLHYYQDSSEKKRFSRDSVYIKASVKWHIKTGRQQDPTKPNDDSYGKGFGVWWDTISVPPMAIYKRGAHKSQSDKDSIPKYKGDGLKDIPDGIDCDTLGNAVWSIKTNNNVAAQAGSAQSEHTAFPKIIFRAIQSNMTDNVREDSIQICALEDFVCKTVKIRQDTPHLSYSYQSNPLRKRMTKDTALYFVHKKYCDQYAPFTKDSIRVRLLNGGMWVIDSMGCYDWDKKFKKRQENDHKQQAQNSNNDKDSIPLFSHPPGTPNSQANNFSYKDDTTIVFWTPKENMTNHRRHCFDSICAVAPEVEESLRNKAQQPPAQLHQPQADRKNKKNKYCLPIRFVQDTPLIVVDQEPAVLDYYRGAHGTIRIGANENYQLLLPDFVKIVACPNPQDRQPTLINPIEQVDQSQINPNVKPINGSGQDAVCCTVNANAQQPPQQAAQPAICNNNNQNQGGPCNSSAQTTTSAAGTSSSGSSSQQLDKNTCQTHAASELQYNEFTNCLLDKKQVSKDTAKHDFIETNMKHLADGTMGIETRQYCFEVRRLYDNDAVIQKKGDGNKNFDLKIYIPKTKDSVKRIAKMIQQPPVFNLSNNEGTAGIGTKSKHVFLSRRAGAGVGTVKLNTNTHWQISGYDANLFEFSPNQGTNRKSQQISVKAKHDNEFDNAIYDTAVFYPTDICQTDRDKFRDTVFIKQDSFWIHVTLRKDKDPKYPSIETINKFPHYVVPAPENDYLRFDVEANAPWVAASYKGVNKTLAWDIINPNPSGFSANDVGLLGLNVFSLPDFLVGRHDSVMLFLLDKAGVRHYRHTIKYYQKPYDFKEENIVVFPNPVKSRLYIKSINSQLFKTGSIFIYALDGSLIASRTYANGVIDFDFDTLPQGVYILKIYDGKVFVTKKIIKG